MYTKRVVLLRTCEDTLKIAKEVSKMVVKSTIVTLIGELGVGKTFFASCLINELLKKEGLPTATVTSPTFNIVKIYDLSQFSIYHFDLYRLKKPEEIYELNIEEAFKNVSIIEWPELIEDILPKDVIKITISLQNEIRNLLIEKNSI
jgi:tRNA threonylcarbamoyladenosine biosynthesis protein TsaE